ncbi:MAG: FeoA family protein [Gemmatimonadota bacterium]|nr:FeoA family protein [Gemmatimonadota bacterium]
MTESSKQKLRPLNQIKDGEVVRFVSVTGGHNIQARLVSMGLFPGTEIEVVKNRRHGPVVLLVKGARLILGRGMSHKILVA